MPKQEHFPLSRPVAVNEIPPLAGIEALSGLSIEGISLPGLPFRNYLAFCDRRQRGSTLPSSCESWILVPHNLAGHIGELYPRARVVSVADPRATFIDVLQHLDRNDLLEGSSLLDAEGEVHSNAIISTRAFVEPGARVDAGARINDGATVMRHVWVQAGAEIGAGTVLGSSGMNAYVGQDGKRRGFPHLGAVIVGAGTQVGSQCVIVRGILSSTAIGVDAIIGNLCNIGHGVTIGDNVWMSAGTIVGGHAGIEDGATIGLRSVIRDNVRVGKNASIGMGSVVTKHVKADASVFGNPAREYPAIKAGPQR